MQRVSFTCSHSEYTRPKCQRPQATHHIIIHSFTHWILTANERTLQTVVVVAQRRRRQQQQWWCGVVVVGGGGDGSPHTIILYFQSVNGYRFAVDALYHIIEFICTNTRNARTKWRILFAQNKIWHIHAPVSIFSSLVALVGENFMILIAIVIEIQLSNKHISMGNQCLACIGLRACVCVHWPIAIYSISTFEH